MTPVPSYVCGLDLGQVRDYTAFAALERTTRADGKQILSVRFVRRFHRGTPYTPGICEGTRALLSTPPLPGCLLAVDQTGVGRPVVDLMRTMQLPATLLPVSITAGATVRFDPDDLAWHVPKKDLVGCLQVLLGTGRLMIAPDLKLDAEAKPGSGAVVLTKELSAFRVKLTKAGNEQFESWREQDHDDLVLAVALACWLAERMPAWGKGAIGTGPRLAGVSADPLRDLPAALRIGGR